eukprot:11138952-Lingulodinium_polyedra.AAC.1
MPLRRPFVPVPFPLVSPRRPLPFGAQPSRARPGRPALCGPPRREARVEAGGAPPGRSWTGQVARPSGPAQGCGLP